MPFTSLSDALAAWFSGAYTGPFTLQYVVDGNPVSDVNSYSVYDIEEVVLVRSAAALVNTADGQQELVIVKTRHGSGKKGMTADAQTGLVNDKEYGHLSALRFYHNYFLNAWQNGDKVSAGVSVNYTRDVYPQYYAEDVVTPDNLQRWRLNGYLSYRPDARILIGLTLNFTPQRFAVADGDLTQPGQYSSSAGITRHYLLPRLFWHCDLPRCAADPSFAARVSSHRPGDELHLR